ncbi:hypothetical protein SAMN05216428_104132 [Nitrosospira sp. Nsp11]|uniref:hypothetical protein n=1 Tax=Nitrosospira sp. Nsp11 TaxID=1855338 RepID=UPI000919327C|nr:hypothetical protein [Nitrosospira sp. Nsp11]SHL63156.1 hypothetical protein SAMN05216428_104132 [Nitrosospira sp. Nsp11]
MKGFFGVVDNCTCFYSIIEPVHDSAKLADELHYVMNTPRLQSRRHLKFWEDYFMDANRRPRSVSTS